jgi:hypothetical protein
MNKDQKTNAPETSTKNSAGSLVETSASTQTFIVKEKKKKGVIRSLMALSFGVDIRRWVGLEELKISFGFLKNLYNSFLKTKEPMHNENFAEAAARLDLDKEDLKKATRNFLYSTIFYSIITTTMAGYTVFIFIASESIIAAIVCIALTIMLATFTFREHFWYIQSKHQKLGCSFKDWANLTFKKSNKPV